MIRWQTWQIVRHNAFLKNPPASPEKLLKFEDEIEADEEKINSAAQRLKEAHGRRRAKGKD